MLPSFRVNVRLSLSLEVGRRKRCRRKAVIRQVVEEDSNFIRTFSALRPPWRPHTGRVRDSASGSPPTPGQVAHHHVGTVLPNTRSMRVAFTSTPTIRTVDKFRPFKTRGLAPLRSTRGSHIDGREIQKGRAPSRSRPLDLARGRRLRLGNGGSVATTDSVPVSRRSRRSVVRCSRREKPVWDHSILQGPSALRIECDEIRSGRVDRPSSKVDILLHRLVSAVPTDGGAQLTCQRRAARTGATDQVAAEMRRASPRAKQGRDAVIAIIETLP